MLFSWVILLEPPPERATLAPDSGIAEVNSLNVHVGHRDNTMRIFTVGLAFVITGCSSTKVAQDPVPIPYGITPDGLGVCMVDGHRLDVVGENYDTLPAKVSFTLYREARYAFFPNAYDPTYYNIWSHSTNMIGSIASCPACDKRGTAWIRAEERRTNLTEP